MTAVQLDGPVGSTTTQLPTSSATDDPFTELVVEHDDARR
jgi:hypothetical protein